MQKLYTTNNSNLKVQYKLINAKVCNNGKCYKINFILTNDITKGIILGTTFLTRIYSFNVLDLGIESKENLFKFINPIIKSIKEMEEDNFLNIIRNKNIK